MYNIYFYREKDGSEPYVKHIEDELWELRPLKDRIFFAVWHGDVFVLLHHFTKKTRKTPRREIKKAKNKLIEFRKRSEDDET